MIRTLTFWVQIRMTCLNAGELSVEVWPSAGTSETTRYPCCCAAGSLARFLVFFLPVMLRPDLLRSFACLLGWASDGSGGEYYERRHALGTLGWVAFDGA